ncbi:MAG: bifunctional UDP-sugar hydrolase/5'-nucleotidase [Candidatus Izemoplasmatales bacterium]|nr:bifunctional UDP-sugar hydrolase/5'-nucleotidase [Candidatus Izemoplasmatales bacterium]
MSERFHFRLLAMSDLHGHLIPESLTDFTQKPSGLCAISSIIAKHRTENTRVLDLGDSIQGSPMMDYHQAHRHSSPNPVAVLFNHLKVDYFVPGNHDFNYGRSYLDQFIDNLNTTKVLCANILDKKNRPAFGLPYDLFTLGEGIKIAIIGVTTQYIPNWERKSHITNLRFENACQVAKRLVEHLKKIENPHLIILAYHGGFEKDLDTFEAYVADTGENLGSRMLEEIPEIDILITGHQHRSIVSTVRNTLVIQPGYNGKAMAVIDVDFIKENGRYAIRKKAILEKTDNYPVDERCVTLLSNIRKETEKYLDIRIGKTTQDLLIKDAFLARRDKHPIVTFINQVQKEKTKADISCCSLGNQVSGFPDIIRIRDVLSTYVFPNTLVVLRIDGQTLKRALEKNAEYFALDEEGRIIANPRYSYPKTEHYNYDMFDGIDYCIDVAQPYGRRIVTLTYQNKPVSTHQSFTLVMNNYRSTGGGEFQMYRNLEIVKEINIDIASLLIDYIKKHKTITIQAHHNIRVINSNQ